MPKSEDAFKKKKKLKAEAGRGMGLSPPFFPQAFFGKSTFAPSSNFCGSQKFLLDRESLFPLFPSSFEMYLGNSGMHLLTFSFF